MNSVTIGKATADGVTVTVQVSRAAIDAATDRTNKDEFSGQRASLAAAIALLQNAQANVGKTAASIDAEAAKAKADVDAKAVAAKAALVSTEAVK